MKTTFDTDSILFGLLNGQTSINGGVYVGDTRPENSSQEDIVVNTIALEQDAMPQSGISNINIYVADTTKKIKNQKQVSANRTRLNALANEALAIIRNAMLTGIKITPTNMEIMYDQVVKQHFVNIRIHWNIQTFNN